MFKLIETVLMAIYGLLPDDPFKPMIDGMSGSSMPSLTLLNWFLPFDTCANVMLAWLACMVGYYVFNLVKKLAFLAIKNIAQLTSIAGAAGAVK